MNEPSDKSETPPTRNKERTSRQRARQSARDKRRNAQEGGTQQNGKGVPEEDETGARVACINEIVGTLAQLPVKEITVGRASRLKYDLSARWSLTRAPKSVELLAAVPETLRETSPAVHAAVCAALKAKPVRTASGIVAVAVMCKPWRCPHTASAANAGRPCLYCPGGVDSDFEYSTQSYTGYEPTSMRAIRARYDAYAQTRARLDQLRRLGHSTDKVELILMGGTFMAMPAAYRERFVCALHDALSGHLNSATVEEAVAYSERSAGSKCVGLTIETRPDMCSAAQIGDLLRYGCTRLELGVQTVYEDVVARIRRGHSVQCVRDAFVRLKDSGLKVVTHMMPDLPGTGAERDVSGFAELFTSADFRPDGLKIYPTIVMRGTDLYALWERGDYANYDLRQLVDVLARALALVPPWTRIYRIQRDIPLPLGSSGVEAGNLREVVLRRMRELGLRCRDVRTREVGIQAIHARVRPGQVELVRRDYAASRGWETFLAYEDPRQDILVAMLRLRRLTPAAGALRPELRAPGGVSMIRELHVYGSAVPVHSRDPRAFQHQGYGSLLVEEAERIARTEHHSARLAVIAGVGVRNYYRRFGFHLEGTYMIKDLAPDSSCDNDFGEDDFGEDDFFDDGPTTPN